ncbi:acetyltransferase [Bifidobacterium actinocoloniiforme DSM 22766]|uniref:Acetyltransferase n=1 Tax=Bifidobacterium actinocoloniiforme DSM 22766 TaxID=1437605 RepID=A0A086YVW4_9BIFI|nr:GNAT family N-acetyltransferase [Bifidobacterium actinocoloniiforme]AKV54937.1 GNAT family acetyltransferase [Bifidobacterium actinocoloniiforme DSM 22766]KFI38414.1 acetyltransferase [Bifidobacterium actinocoloniiforme DSM 22766]
MSGADARGVLQEPEGRQVERELPSRIDIPYINGEMVHLRPATIADLTRMDELQAFYNSTGITGKGPEAERAVVNAWVRRSVAWSKGQTPRESGVGDPESRRTVAWAMITEADHDKDGATDASATDGVIGMIFLIDVDGWSRSARIQVVLGRDYRGRGYSRDAMPRVMTYGYAARPAGLGLHRIWVAVPEKNTRSISVYQSLGFMVSGTSRDALWDEQGGKYQDQIVMDALVDEYDPIRSLDAFGMHVIEGNPGVAEALVNHRRALESGEVADLAVEEAVAQSEEERRKARRAQLAGAKARARAKAEAGAEAEAEADAQARVPGQDQLQAQESTQTSGSGDDGAAGVEAELSGGDPQATVQEPGRERSAAPEEGGQETTGSGEPQEEPGEPVEPASQDDATTWAYSDSSRKKGSKQAWWRNLGHGGKRNAGGKS